MPIELICRGCGQTLRVPDAAAGKQARCPSCQEVQTIPGPAGEQPSPPAETPLYIRDEPKPAGNPYSDQPVNPYASPAPLPGRTSTPRAPAYSRAHRGVSILILGILSLICNLCFIPSIMALVMGNEDLRLMESGQMDPSGRTMTNIGMVLAVVGLVCGAIGAVLRIVTMMAD